MVSQSTLIVAGTGFVAVLAGLYQFYNNRMGGLRMVGAIDRNSDVGEAESVLGIITGIVLVISGIFFLWLGGVILLAWLFNAL